MALELNISNIPQVFHPGETLSEKLEELGIGSKELAIRTGKPEQTISKVLNGKSSITPEMAVLFEMVLGISAQFWMNLQRQYDEFMVRIEEENKIIKAKEWAINFPYSEMSKKGWVNPTRNWKEKVSNLFEYFNIAVPKAWEDYFLNKKLSARFRISLKSIKDPYALSAWLRKGELMAKEYNCPPFEEKKLIRILPKLKLIMVNHPDDYWEQIVDLAYATGLKVIFTPCLKNTSVNGVSRWIDKHPVIQVSDRMKRYDVFWFTLFHEIGHILLHPTRYISIEDTTFLGEKIKEREANDFAIKCTFSKDEEKEFMSNYQITKNDVCKYALKTQNHPSIIVGRLAHQKQITHQIAGAWKLYEKLNINPEIGFNNLVRFVNSLHPDSLTNDEIEDYRAILFIITKNEFVLHFTIYKDQFTLPDPEIILNIFEGNAKIESIFNNLSDVKQKLKNYFPYK